MSFDLNFSEEFFYNVSEPYDSNEPIKDKPTSVWEAICHCQQKDPMKWEHIANDVFKLASGYSLSEESVMNKIRETNTCSNLDSPVQVWIDSQGFFTLSVY